MLSRPLSYLSLLSVVAACAADEIPETDSAAMAHMHEGGGHGHCEPAPVMQTGDFNGSGTLDPGDLDMISAYIDAGDYAAFFDLNADGKLDGKDVSAVAKNLGDPGSARDGQMALLWAEVEPYRNIGNALAAGFVPFTPDVAGHGVHFVDFDRIYSRGSEVIGAWAGGGSAPFHPELVEGLNYSADNELIAAFYYSPGAVDLVELGMPVAPETVYAPVPLPDTFAGMMPHEWHNHTGACFGGATSPLPGFDQCMTKPECDAVGGQLWSDQFHMLHVWLFEFNQCGPFAGIDPDVSVGAPEEPNHMACELTDVVPCLTDWAGGCL